MRKRVLVGIIVFSLLIGGFLAIAFTYRGGFIAGITNPIDAIKDFADKIIHPGNESTSQKPFDEANYPYLNSYAPVETRIITPTEIEEILEINATAARHDELFMPNLPPQRQLWYTLTASNLSNKSITIVGYTVSWILKTIDGKILKQGKYVADGQISVTLEPNETISINHWYDFLDDLPAEDIKYLNDVHLMQIEMEIKDVKFLQ